MNNFINNLNEGNKLGIMLLYGENGSFIPVDMFYLIVTFHTCKKYDLKNPDTLYYDDDVHFISKDDNKTIIMDVQSCIKLFEKYINIDYDFSLDNVNFDILKRYGKVDLKNYKLYSLDDLNVYYKSGRNQMGRNYSLIPVIIDKEKLEDEFDYIDDFDDELEENIRKRKYIDSNIVRKLRKRKYKN